MSNIVIDIAAEFTGNKAFKSAETSTEKLTKNVKKLAGAIGLGFGTAQVIAFGKASVKAALNQQAEQNRLNQLLKVGVGATSQEIALLNEQAAALEKIGVVAGGNITQTQSQLATFNLQVSTIEALTPAILDYVTAEKGATASTADFKSMTNGLAQALNGNFGSLTRVGFVLDENTKKQIANGTEAERANALVKVLNSTYKDFNKNLRLTDAGKMQVLSNAAEDAKTIIGIGLLDALKGLGNDKSVESLATNMQDLSIFTADVIRGIGKLTGVLKGLPVVNNLNVGMIPIVGSFIKILRASGQVAGQVKAADNAHLKSLISQFSVTKKIVKSKTVLTAAQIAAAKAAKLKLATDKATLALGKGEEIFDMDKIQIAAALTGQAQALGKATSAAQVLAITNDIARLNVKASMLALEDALASKDEAAITAATAKLNADLKILGALSGQSVKLTDIKSILDSLKPKDLIDQANLDVAMGKIKAMLALLATMSGTININTAAAGNPLATPAAAVAAAVAVIPKVLADPDPDPVIPLVILDAKEITLAEIDAIVDFAEAAAERANAVAALTDSITESNAAILAANSNVAVVDVGLAARSNMLGGMLGGAGFASAVSGSRYAAQAAAQYNITIQSGIGDPNAIAEAIDQVIRASRDRGTLSALIT